MSSASGVVSPNELSISDELHHSTSLRKRMNISARKLLCSRISLSFFGFVKTVFTFSSLNLNLYCQLLKQINFAFFFVLYALTTRVLHTVLSFSPLSSLPLIGLDFHLISNSQPRTECARV